ncbi:MAG: hypothetical protein WAO20_07405 [Acidobacteriota bacterium]
MLWRIEKPGDEPEGKPSQGNEADARGYGSEAAHSSDPGELAAVFDEAGGTLGEVVDEVVWNRGEWTRRHRSQHFGPRAVGSVRIREVGSEQLLAGTQEPSLLFCGQRLVSECCL